MTDTASILLCLPDGTALFDPDPAVTEQRDLQLVEAWDDTVIGIVGWSSGGIEALAAAADHQEIERLVLVSTPYPETTVETRPEAVAAKTLLLFGSSDPATGSAHGRSWKKHLATARLEMVPGGGPDLLVPMWGRVLSHLAPRRRR